MIIGVAFFSNFVGTFINVADSLSDNSQQQNQTDLNNWITILKYFTHGKQLPKEFIRKLEENFEYYWEEDRLGDITPENEYVQALPSSMKYLFGDVFHNYTVNSSTRSKTKTPLS